MNRQDKIGYRWAGPSSWVREPGNRSQRRPDRLFDNLAGWLT